MDSNDWAEIGRSIVNQGRLAALREELGLSRAAMAALLYISPVTYASWERARPEDDPRRMWDDRAARVGRLYLAAKSQLQRLRDEGVEIDQLMPLHLAAVQLGVPQDVLFARIRQGEFEAVDLGLVGLWLHRSDL